MSDSIVETNLPEFVTSDIGEQILGGKKEHGAFFYYVRTGKIRKQKAGKRATLYRSSDILQVREKREGRKKKDRELVGETDWVQEKDLPYLLALDYDMYGIEKTVDISITGQWWKKNPYMCRILFDKEDRTKIWGAITIIPMEEHIIHQILRDEILERDILPRDILTYKKGQSYYGYIPSSMIRSERRHHFRKLIKSVFDYWCEQYPDVQFKKLYAFAASKEGEILIKHLYFSPRYDLGEKSFELDLYRPTPSKLIKDFQMCIQNKQHEAA